MPSPNPVFQHQIKASTCAYCGVGCGIIANNSAGKVSIAGDPNHPANFGKLCSKGSTLAQTISTSGRLITPQVNGQVSSWDHALDSSAAAIQDSIKKYGPDSVAFYVSGQLLTEDYYVANKLMKGFIGSNNIDTNSRLCMASAVAGHKRAFGADLVPACYEDLEHCDLLVLCGSNLAWCHPILFQRVKAAKLNNPEMRVVVIDPRETASCEIADLHLAIKPGSDVALFNYLATAILNNEPLDQHFAKEHCEGLNALSHDLNSQNLSLSSTAKTCDISGENLSLFVDWFLKTPRTVTAFSQGVNQSSQGVDKVNSIINCHLLTGRIGKVGAAPFSITGQPNAMGGREVGGLANTLAAHMDYQNSEHRQIVENFWQCDALSQTPGLKAQQLFEHVKAGQVKVIWIMATNPVVSLGNSDLVKQALELCPTVIVSDCIENTDTTRYANILLPAMGWSEKDGTVTNSERCISRQRQIVQPLDNVKADWQIICELAAKMGFSEQFDYQNAHQIFIEHAALSGISNNGSRAFDISAMADLNAQQYENLNPTQWPLTTTDKSSRSRLFSDGRFYTASRKAQLIAVQHKQAKHLCDENYPFILNTGRIRDQWHTQTRSRLSAQLNNHQSEAYLSLHPNDINQLGLKNESIVTIKSHWGQAQARLISDPKQRVGEVFCPIHWSDSNSSQSRISAVVNNATDPISGQPEFKYTPVSISQSRYQSEAVLLVKSSILKQLKSLKVGYWSEQVLANGFAYHISDLSSPQQLFERLKPLALLNSKGLSLQHEDLEQHKHHWVAYSDMRLNMCLTCAPQIPISKRQWLANAHGQLQAKEIRSLLTDEVAGNLAKGRIICSCKQVGENQIIELLQGDEINDFDGLQLRTQAGTGCGSCVSELRTFVDQHLVISSQYLEE
ncbi:nitrate reductase [Alginatibacterium sediminis]|uniref:Nitrate reductase n=1 Tax=Alginatibacterium sediminis TaxID=2164068 RepID=A0A420EI73_9ALTE|nr:nitrate reductase [Alginatibacterium sediminis]RKF20344.1 nitrate reductase [Alginatibacterium sediminis]